MLAILLLVSMTVRSAPGVAGVWTAARDYGPSTRGGTVLLTRNRTWSASLGSMQASAPASNAPRFFFTDGSELRIRSQHGLRGQWIQPGNSENPERIATPVTFAQNGAHRWGGAIHPLPDVQHLFLYIAPAAGGAVHAFIRNPEENVGARLGERSVALRGGTLRLQRAGKSDVLGAWDSRTDSIALSDPGLPGRFEFRRAAQAPGTRYAYAPPARDGDGWQTATLRGAAVNQRAIEALVEGIRGAVPGVSAPYIQSLLIARHGKLVLDVYFNGYDAARPHDVRSAGKSVTALLVGRAMEDSRAFSARTRVASILMQYEPFANDDGRKQRIAVGNLLSMSAGYACDDNDDNSPGNEDTMQSQTREPDWYRYTLDLPMLFAPGADARYCSAQINLLGAIVSKATGAWLPEYFYDRFAQPLQFGSYGMWLTPPPLTTAYMAGGDYVRPRDFLKFGQLFLSGGRWNGRQVIDAAWLAQCAAQHSIVADSGPYGYGWHLLTYTVRGRPIRAINAGGNGGQLLYVFPQLDMAVMVTAANYGQFPVWRRFGADLVPQILRAVR